MTDVIRIIEGASVVPVQIPIMGGQGPKGDKGDTGDVTPELQQARDEAVAAAGTSAEQSGLSVAARAGAEAARDTAITKADEAVAAAAAAALAATTISIATWSALSAVTPAFVGQRGTVSASDTGSHVGRTAASPDADVTVPLNAGVYGAYALSAGAWRRDGDLSAVGLASPSEGIAGLRSDVAMTPESDKAALDRRIAPGITIEPEGPDSIWRVVFTALNTFGQKVVYGGLKKATNRWLLDLDPGSDVPIEALGDAATRMLPAGVKAFIGGPDSPYIVAFTCSPAVDGPVYDLGGLLKDGSWRLKLSPQSQYPRLAPSTWIPRPSLLINGDSIAFAIGTTEMSDLLGGIPVTNIARGGYQSGPIAAMMGARPLYASALGNQIPASGPVVLTSISIDQIMNGGNMALSGLVHTVEWAGVLGTLSVSNPATSEYSFTRAVAGSVVAVAPNTQMLFPGVEAYKDKFVYIEAGNNNVTDGYQVYSDICAMIDFLTPIVKGVRIMTPVANGPGWNDNKDYAISVLRRMLPPSVLFDLRSLIISDGLRMCGITPTEQDEIDIEANNTPTSLRNPGDPIHFTSSTYVNCIRPLIARDYRNIRGI